MPSDGAHDVREQAAVVVAGLDVALEPDRCARWEQLVRAGRRLGPEALDRRVRLHGLRCVDADQPHRLAPAVDVDDDRVAVDDPLDGGVRGDGAGAGGERRRVERRGVERVAASARQAAKESAAATHRAAALRMGAGLAGAAPDRARALDRHHARDVVTGSASLALLPLASDRCSRDHDHDALAQRPQAHADAAGHEEHHDQQREPEDDADGGDAAGGEHPNSGGATCRRPTGMPLWSKVHSDT